MNNDIKSLEKYLMPKFNIELINNSSNFCENWKLIYQSKDKVNMFLNIFKKFNLLQNFIKYIESYIRDVLFIKVDNSEYMIIKIIMPDQTVFYYGGLNPSLSKDNLLSKVNLPENIKSMYKYFIDGFYDIMYGHMGLYSLENVDNVDDYEWSFLPKNIIAKNYYMFFSNGAGAYLISNKHNFRTYLMYTDSDPKSVNDFEEYIDNWLVDALTHY